MVENIKIRAFTITQTTILKSIIFLFMFSLALTASLRAQDDWSEWNKKYQAINYSELVNFEKKYADSVEKDTSIEQNFARIGKYRVKAKYLGQKRNIDAEVQKSMEWVYKLFIGKPDDLRKMLKTEFLFEIEGVEVWAPIQNQMEDAFIEEIPKNTELALYCLFFNEHTLKGKLFNTLLISEFKKDIN